MYINTLKIVKDFMQLVCYLQTISAIGDPCGFSTTVDLSMGAKLFASCDQTTPEVRVLKNPGSIEQEWFKLENTYNPPEALRSERQALIDGLLEVRNRILVELDKEQERVRSVLALWPRTPPIQLAKLSKLVR
jgi:hypothetical protein